MNDEPTRTDGSAEAEGRERENDETAHECPACGDVFEGDAEYRDHILSVGLVY